MTKSQLEDLRRRTRMVAAQKARDEPLHSGPMEHNTAVAEFHAELRRWETAVASGMRVAPEVERRLRKMASYLEERREILRTRP